MSLSGVLKILYSMEKPPDRFAAAPDLDDPFLLDLVEMVIVADQNRISIKAGAVFLATDASWPAHP